MSITLTELRRVYDDWLRPDAFEDFCHNGIQVLGSEEISEAWFALDGSLELFEAAPEKAALVVHHGVIWRKLSTIDGQFHRRLKVMMAKEQTLIAMHLPLDGHPTLGTAATVAKRLGIETTEGFGLHGKETVGRRGNLPEAFTPAAFLQLVQEKLGAPHAQLLPGDGRMIQDVGIVTGGGASYFEYAIESGCDAFLTGEPRYEVVYPSKERGTPFIAGGHYHTEIWGVQSLMEATGMAFPELTCKLFEAPVGI